MLRGVLSLISLLIIISYIYSILSGTANAPKIPDNNENSYFKISHVQLNNDDEILKLGLTPKSSVRLEHLNGDKQLIHGRFLHITDMHPDEFYKIGSSIEKSCHRGGKNSKPHDKASKYGDAIKGCDSPLILVQETLQWISNNLKDKIDFVVWTGDNIRHDNDRGYPRLETNIFEMNEKIADMVYTSLQDDEDDNNSNNRVKIVPSLGNNDVYPHNLFSPGPTLQTRELYKIWKNFIPSEQLHVFARGAYFFQEIIPNKLAVLSINTLYLFRSNPLVDNCDNKKEPGYKLFEWLGVTLKELRARGMKVWLTGHVPPTPKNYDTTCLRKHIVWLYEYRDIIIGSLYGHMNIDHFIPLDSQKAYRSINKSLQKFGINSNVFDVLEGEEDDDDFKDLEELNSYLNVIADDEIFGSEPHIMGGAPMGKVEYMESIRDAFYSRVKGRKKSGINSERYSIAHISSSIVPTFNPGIRVWEYNTTGLFESEDINQYTPWTQFLSNLDLELFANDDDFKIDNEESGEIDYHSMTEEKLVDILKNDKTFPPKMPVGTPLGPAYSPQLFSPERYVQYYVDLKKLNKQAEGDKDVKLEYEIEYETDDEHYKLKSLLVDDWINFARKLGKPLKKQKRGGQQQQIINVEDAKKKDKKLEKLWKRYLNRSFVGTGYEEMDDYNQ